ncbi:hypothetical protein ACQZV8_10465 [Magnetococcales bacterium HHB-1]
MASIKSKRVLTIVNRGIMDSVPMVVYQHEVLLLKALHGEQNVRFVENDLPDLGFNDILEMDTFEEWDRLKGKYGIHPTLSIPVVEYIYGARHEDRLANTGLSSQDCQVLQQAQESQKKQHSQQTNPKTGTTTLKETRLPHCDLTVMDAQKLLKQLGVPARKNQKPELLEKKLLEALKEDIHKQGMNPPSEEMPLSELLLFWQEISTVQEKQA